MLDVSSGACSLQHSLRIRPRPETTENPKRAGQEKTMLASMNMVGFLLTRDYDKARAFYEGTLGFEFVSLDKFALVMKAGKSAIRIVKVPTFTPLESTVLGWAVDDIEAMVAWLA